MTLPAGTRVEAIGDLARALVEAGEAAAGVVESSGIDSRDGGEYLTIRLDAGNYIVGTQAEEWRAACRC